MLTSSPTHGWEKLKNEKPFMEEKGKRQLGILRRVWRRMKKCNTNKYNTKLDHF
jgi:hypothetical protein